MNQRSKISVVDMSIAELMMILIMISLWLFITNTTNPDSKAIDPQLSLTGPEISFQAACAKQITGANSKVTGFLSGISYNENEYNITSKQRYCLLNICREIVNFVDRHPIDGKIEVVGFASKTNFSDNASLGFPCSKIGGSKGCNELISWMRAKIFVDSCFRTKDLVSDATVNYWSPNETKRIRNRISLNAFGNWTTGKSDRFCSSKNKNCKDGRVLELYFSRNNDENIEN